MTEETLFAAALERTLATERQAFLDEACAGEVTLRRRVARLLAAHEKPRGILDRPDGPGAPEDPGRPTVCVVPGELPLAPVAGRYELLEMIGEGGMGTVWLAEQTEPVRRKVALKLVRAGAHSRSVLARFEVERQALAMMDHPNIAKVLDGGTTEGGRPFFAMEYVEGVPITRHCDDARLSVPRRLELFLSVCQAVQHAHTKGIIHRDLKPSNVLVARYDGEPVPKVIDFGVAKATGPRPAEWSTLTQYGELVGTLLYMSPEQARMCLDIDAQSDVYALGVLLYELLTGSTPFEWKSPDEGSFDHILRSLREREPQTPSGRLATTADLPDIAARRGAEPARLGRMVRGDLDWIVMKALEKDRARRYQTPSDLAMDLKRYLHDEPVLACPPSLRHRLRKFVRRNRGPVLAAASIVLALVVGIIGTTWGMIRARDAMAVARGSERDAKDRLFVALLNRARAGRSSRQMGQRLESLATVAQAARIRREDRLRDEAIAALALPDLNRVPIRRSSPPGTAAVSYGGEYRLYARADQLGGISVRSLPDDLEVRRFSPGSIEPAYRLFLSPDERFLLAFGPGRELRVWRMADGRPALRDRLGGCGTHAYSPDGKQLAVGQREWVVFFDLTTGSELRRWRLRVPAHTLAFDPGGGKLAVGYSQGRFASVFDAECGTALVDLPVGAMGGQVVAWHPDGRRLAVAGSDPQIQVWDVEARRQVASLTGHVNQVSELTFHPDGGLLASYSWDGVLRLWDPATARPLLQLPFTVEGRPRFSRDGRWLGATQHGDRADLLEVTPSREYRTLVSSAGAGRGGYNQADFSPDGRMMVVAMNEGARIWDLRSGKELAALPPWTTYACFDVAAESDGTSEIRAALLTCGPDGLLRWPIAADDPEGRRLRLLAPRRLSELERACFAPGADGRTLGVATVEGGKNQVVDLQTGAVRRELDAHPSGDVRALSRDGRWAASCGWHSDRVRLWDLRTGRKVYEWPARRATVSFTPDSRALVIARGDEFSVWDVETFRLIRRLPREVTQYPGHVAFSPDGRLMAMEMAPAVMDLKDAASGRTVARLEDPHGDRATWQGFTPDGTRLVTITGHESAIHIWDLRAVRARLKEMNLDWDWPDLPAAATAGPDAGPVTIEAPPEHLLWQLAIERWRGEVAAHPDSAKACNALAWIYVSAPEPLRDVEAALPLAEKALRLAPKAAVHRNTLGLAYYRAGRYREAAETLRPNLQGQWDGGLAYDLYFLAMSHQRLGEPDRARDYYDWALRWERMQRHLRADQVAELAGYRAEAETVLGIGPTRDESPPTTARASSGR